MILASPLLSTVPVALGGIAVAYSLWYSLARLIRYRSHDRQLRQLEIRRLELELEREHELVELNFKRMETQHRKLTEDERRRRTLMEYTHAAQLLSELAVRDALSELASEEETEAGAQLDTGKPAPKGSHS